MRPRFVVLAMVVAGAAGLQEAPLGGQDKPTLVAVKALEAFLPEPPGWTKGAVNSNRVEISDTVAYTSADAVYTKGEMKARVAVADSGLNPDCLTSLASMVMLPDDYSETIDATIIKRLVVGGFPAASRWDGKKSEGEFGILVAKRFVAKAEGTHLDGIDTLRAIVEKIDLTKLAELK